MPELDEGELAATYGWAMATLNAVPDLRRVFRNAVRNTWTPAKFVAEVRNTRWFRSLPASAREAAVLRTSDPAEYRRRLAASKQKLTTAWGRLAGNMRVSPQMMDRMAGDALTLGLTDEEIMARVGRAANFKARARWGDLGGYAGEVESAIEKAVQDYGVSVSREWIGGQVSQVFSGRETPQGAVDKIRNYAKSAYPGLARQIDGGMTVREIADPYRQAMGNLLEMNPSSIDIFDMKIKHALQSETDEGKPGPMPLWKFEQRLRADPRWRKTQNAQDAVMGVGRYLTQSMGLTT